MGTLFCLLLYNCFPFIISRPGSSKCSLEVYFKEKLVSLDLCLNTSLSDVKKLIESETGVPSAEQVLSGWPEHSQSELEDNMTLSELGVCRGVYLIRMDRQHPAHYSVVPPLNFHLSPQSLEHHNEFHPPPNPKIVTLSMEDGRSASAEPGEKATFTATLSGFPEKTGSDIGSMSVHPGSVDDRLSSSQGSWWDVASSSDLPGNKKEEGSDKEPVDGESEIKKEKTSLPVPEKSPDMDKPEETEEEEGSYSSDSSYYNDCDDEGGLEALFGEDDLYMEDRNNMRTLRKTLVPEVCTDPYEALQYFTLSFEQRYGAMHPLFLLGSLSEAVSEATIGTASSGTKKPLLMYLHHDSSVFSNIFCSQLLCSKSVVNYLSLNYVSWAWDLTHYSHRIKLLQMIDESFGADGKTKVNEIEADQFPVILLAYEERGSIRIKQVVKGGTPVDSLMSTLVSTLQQYNNAIQIEQDRMVRENIIADQNRAYEESLMADREKDRKKMEQDRIKKEQDRIKKEQERKKKEQEEEEEAERQAREAERRALSENVPEEPARDSHDKMCTLRLRYPDGEVGQRRFLALHTLGDIFNFIGSKSYFVDKYKILTGFPRTDLSDLALDLTLEELKLCPTQTLIVEKRKYHTHQGV